MVNGCNLSQAACKNCLLFDVFIKRPLYLIYGKICATVDFYRLKVRLRAEKSDLG